MDRHEGHCIVIVTTTSGRRPAFGPIEIATFCEDKVAFCDLVMAKRVPGQPGKFITWFRGTLMGVSLESTKQEHLLNFDLYIDYVLSSECASFH